MISDGSMYRPSGVTHPVIWILCIFIVTMVSWSFLGHLDVVTSARGRVINEGQIKSVQAAVSGSVQAIRVKEGDFVRAGDVLVELEGIEFQADVISMRERIEQLETELARLNAESKNLSEFAQPLGLDRQAERYATQRAIQETRKANLRQREQELRASIEGRRAALASGQSLLRGQEARLVIAKEKEQRALPYIDIAIPRFQYLQLKDDVLVLERDITTQRLTNDRLAQEIEEADQRLPQLASLQKQEIAQEISDKRSILAQLKSDLNKAAKQLSNTRIRAPQDGIVQKVMLTTVGGIVNPSDVLLQIVPADTRLLIEVFIPNEEKGYLKVGQPVDIKLDAFPFQKYGRLEGQLEWISPDAELSTNANISLLTDAAQVRALTSSIPQYVYRGHVVAGSQSNQKLQLAPGLTAQVDIYTDRRRIIDFFLFPLEKAADEALRVR